MKLKSNDPEVVFEGRQKKRGKALFLTKAERLFLVKHIFPDLAVHARSINRLLWTWEHFVDDIEKGYRATGIEYMNDLSSRRVLTKVVATAPPTLKAKLLPVLQPIDKRYRAATTKTRVPIYGATRQFGWWDYRFPKTLTPSLEQWAHFRGFLEAGERP